MKRRNQKSLIFMFLMLALMTALTGCISTGGSSGGDEGGEAMDVTPVYKNPVASGVDVYGNDVVEVDISDRQKGYINARYFGSSSSVVLRLSHGDTTVATNFYNYFIQATENYSTFPLTFGDGDYVLTVFEHLEGDSYVQVFDVSFSVSITEEFGAYLYPNWYVNYTSDSDIFQLSGTVAAGSVDELQVVEKVYNYVVGNIRYDEEKPYTVQSTYTPSLDRVVDSKTGICLDYASVMTAMLRAQEIPTRLVFGYVEGNVYHAWIDVYVEDVGWVNGVIQFDGTSWVRMDPTFASSQGEKNKDLAQFVGDGTNYQSMHYF